MNMNEILTQDYFDFSGCWALGKTHIFCRTMFDIIIFRIGPFHVNILLFEVLSLRKVHNNRIVSFQRLVSNI